MKNEIEGDSSGRTACSNIMSGSGHIKLTKLLQE